MKKKIFLFLSVLALALTFGAIGASAEFSDVSETSPYREAVTTLSMLKTSGGQNIINGYEDGTYKTDGAVTRAECAKIISGVLNYPNLPVGVDTFSDISDHWAKDNITLCASLGIINGMGDGTFAPDAQVTYEQALKMAVCMLGYGAMAEFNGGYPDGYIAQAASLGLQDSITGITFTSNAPRGVIAQIIFNALEVNIAETNSAGTVSVSSKTPLSDYLKLEKTRGILVGVEDFVTADCSYTLSRGIMDIMTGSGYEQLINYTTYSADINSIRTHLGKTLNVYCREGVDYPELIAIDDESLKNKVIDIRSSDIRSYNGSRLSYYVNGRNAQNETLDADAISISYNGKLVNKNDRVTLTSDSGARTVNARTALAEWLDPGSDFFIYGTVRLVDSRADGSLDIIEIYDYETLVAYARPSTSDYMIQDKLKTAHSIILNPDSPDYTYTITRNNTSIETTGISANDVLLYARSLDGTLYTVTASSESVTGTIAETNDAESTITIDGETYPVSDKCIDYLSSSSGRTLRAGLSGTFYLDSLGAIVFAELGTETEIPYAYIVTASIDVASDTGYMTVFLPSSDSSNAKVFPMAERIQVNGTSMKYKNAVALLKQTSGQSNKDSGRADQIYGVNRMPTFTDTAQIARVKLNSSGSVSEIITLDDTYAEHTQNEDSSKLVRYQSLGRYYYTSNSFKESSSSTSTLFTTNSSTSVIYVPMNRSDRTAYSKRAVSSAFTAGESYYVEAYNVNSSKIAGLIVMYGTDGSMTNVSRTTEFSIVASQPSAAFNSDTGETTLGISVYKGAVNTAALWKTYDKTEFADVQIGDVIQFAYDNNQLAQGLVTNIRFSDIAAVLDDTYSNTIYDWNVRQSPSAGNNWQSYMFDYRFKAVDSSGSPIWDSSNSQYKDEAYTSTALGTVPYLRAYMANVSQVLPDEGRLYLTKSGFTKSGGEWIYDESDYEELTVTSSTKIIRMDNDRRGFDRYVEDTTSDLTYRDLRDAKNYGINCSKVLVCTLRGAVRLIVIYE